MMSLIQKLVRREEGATAIEYGLIAALIAVAIIGGANVVGGSLETLFNSVGTELTDAVTPAATPTP